MVVIEVVVVVHLGFPLVPENLEFAFGDHGKYLAAAVTRNRIWERISAPVASNTHDFRSITYGA